MAESMLEVRGVAMLSQGPDRIGLRMFGLDVVDWASEADAERFDGLKVRFGVVP